MAALFVFFAHNSQNLVFLGYSIIYKNGIAVGLGRIYLSIVEPLYFSSGMDKSIINYEYEFLLQNDKIGHFLLPASQLSHSDAHQTF